MAEDIHGINCGNLHRKSPKPLWPRTFLPRYLYRFAMLVAESLHSRIAVCLRLDTHSLLVKLWKGENSPRGNEKRHPSGCLFVSCKSCRVGYRIKSTLHLFCLHIAKSYLIFFHDNVKGAIAELAVKFVLHLFFQG